jgi:putative colanic acid biosynthesis acetyltransferase WcaF
MNTASANEITQNVRIPSSCRSVVWRITWYCLAKWTPPGLRWWRRKLLHGFGAKVAETADIYGSAIIHYPENLEMAAYSGIGPRAVIDCTDRVRLGPFASISQDTHVSTVTLSVEDAGMRAVTAPITIEEHAWIAADCFIGPGVTVGAGAVLGAGGVTFDDLKAHMIYIGNPAYCLRPRAIHSNKFTNS